MFRISCATEEAKVELINIQFYKKKVLINTINYLAYYFPTCWIKGTVKKQNKAIFVTNRYIIYFCQK